DHIQWMAVLKSASAFEMYRKEHHTITPNKVAEFLIFDSQFPRSIRHCINKAKICLHRITGTPEGAAINAAEKRLGRIQADIEYTDIEEVIEIGLHEYLDSLQIKINDVGAAIGTTFFNLKPLVDISGNEQ
ncbi:MAG: alpha-E domain-containing protein, partial [Proteobacteria bacterium]|nr:alpha-E domain-containing protein [Pseudomonadota bacterium]